MDEQFDPGVYEDSKPDPMIYINGIDSRLIDMRMKEKGITQEQALKELMYELRPGDPSPELIERMRKNNSDNIMLKDGKGFMAGFDILHFDK